jgi:hypothetical protein
MFGDGSWAREFMLWLSSVIQSESFQVFTAVAFFLVTLYVSFVIVNWAIRVLRESR